MKSANETYEGKAQELFNDVVSHLRKQKCRAVNGNNCVYLALDGTKCAIGGILPDELYFSGLEGSGVSLFWNKNCWIDENYPNVVKVANFIGESNKQLATELQIIHDRRFPENWEEALEKLAKQEGLVYEENLEECAV